jgi:hypothetical protein
MALAGLAALAACTTTLFTHKLPLPDAPICVLTADAARQDFDTGACVRLSWDVGDKPGDLTDVACAIEPAGGASGAGVCGSAERLSRVEPRGELAQLLACGRGTAVLVEDLWRYGEETYGGEETLAFDGRPLRVRWRGGLAGQEILLGPTSSAPGASCSFTSMSGG